jgi:hypothetical protein
MSLIEGKKEWAKDEISNPFAAKYATASLVATFIMREENV